MNLGSVPAYAYFYLAALGVAWAWLQKRRHGGPGGPAAA